MNGLSTLIINILIAHCSFSQTVSNKDVLGSWIINDTGGIHKHFIVEFKFCDDSTFNSIINGELTTEFYFKITNKNDSAFIFFKFQKDDPTWSDNHWLFVSKDTLNIIPYYFLRKPEYSLNRGDKIYFIRSLKDK